MSCELIDVCCHLLHRKTLSVPADSLGLTTHLNGPPLQRVRSSAQKPRTSASVVASFWVTARTPFLRISSCMMYLLRRAWRVGDRWEMSDE